MNPQTVNEAGNGGWLDINTGEIRVGGVGDINLAGNVENALNWAPRLGAAYQLNEKTVLRAGYGRSYDIGVFGSTFGHSVTQNLPVLAFQDLNPPNTFQSVFNLAQGPPAPVFPAVPSNGRFPLPNGVGARLLPDKQNLAHVDAYNVTLQRQLSATSRWRSPTWATAGRGFIGDGPAANYNQATIVGLRNALPATSASRSSAATAGRRASTSSATRARAATTRCRPSSPGASPTASRSLTHYTLQSHKNDDGGYFFVDPDVDYGPANFIRTHVYVLAATAELPFGKGKRYLSDASRRRGRDPRRLAAQRRRHHHERPALQRELPRPRARTATPAPAVRTSSAIRTSGSGDGLTSPVLQRDAHRLGGQRLRPAGPRHLRRHGAQRAARSRVTGTWTPRCSSASTSPAASTCEFRVEAQNVFNHVNLGNPNAEVGVPGNNNPTRRLHHGHGAEPRAAQPAVRPEVRVLSA